MKSKQKTKSLYRNFLSGGESGTPGFAIFRKGGDIGAVVSTGNLTWSIEVVANVPEKQKWTNVAVRWQTPLAETQEEYQVILISRERKRKYFVLKSTDSFCVSI